MQERGSEAKPQAPPRPPDTSTLAHPTPLHPSLRAASGALLPVLATGCSLLATGHSLAGC